MQEFISKNYVKYHKGNGLLFCHVEAIHAVPPAADRFTDNIVLGIMAQTNCAGIISTVSRQIADLNKAPDGFNNEGLKEYRDSVREIIDQLGILQKNERINRNYLHLSIHGMRDEHHGPFAIEIGTRNGQSCSKEMKKWLKETLMRKASELIPRIDIVFDEKFVGDPSLVFHRRGDGNEYKGYGTKFHTFQLEIAHYLRENFHPVVVELLAHTISEFQKKEFTF
ncbi:MAG TPA: hypothetical protein DDY49_13375 [Paenibacillaceae bacterium]|nr:hypothetical protein [Paenibacillaceae bacterium]